MLSGFAERFVYAAPAPTYTAQDMPGLLCWLPWKEAAPPPKMAPPSSRSVDRLSSQLAPEAAGVAALSRGCLSTGGGCAVAGAAAPAARDAGVPELLPCLWVEAAESTKVLMYFHANAEDLGLLVPALRQMQKQLRVGILAIEYPGYGLLKDHSASEDMVHRAASVALRYIVEDMGGDYSQVILLGRSIGSSPALYLASKFPIGGLILMNAFTSMRDVAVIHVGPMLGNLAFGEDNFCNESKIQDVACPTLFVHAAADTVVPVEHSKKLFQLCQARKLLVTPEGMDHNSNLMQRPAFVSLPAVHFFHITSSLPGHQPLKMPTSAFHRPLVAGPQGGAGIFSWRPCAPSPETVSETTGAPTRFLEEEEEEQETAASGVVHVAHLAGVQGSPGLSMLASRVGARAQAAAAQRPTRPTAAWTLGSPGSPGRAGPRRSTQELPPSQPGPLLAEDAIPEPVTARMRADHSVETESVWAFSEQLALPGDGRRAQEESFASFRALESFASFRALVHELRELPPPDDTVLDEEEVFEDLPRPNVRPAISETPSSARESADTPTLARERSEAPQSVGQGVQPAPGCQGGQPAPSVSGRVVWRRPHSRGSSRGSSQAGSKASSRAASKDLPAPRRNSLDRMAARLAQPVFGADAAGAEEWQPAKLRSSWSERLQVRPEVAKLAWAATKANVRDLPPL